MKKLFKALILSLILIVSATAFAAPKKSDVLPPDDGGGTMEQMKGVWDG